MKRYSGNDDYSFDTYKRILQGETDSRTKEHILHKAEQYGDIFPDEFLELCKIAYQD